MGSSKPCPGCGEVAAYRPAKEVCGECKRLLKLAIETEKRLEFQDSDTECVSIPEMPHWLPYISHGYVPGEAEHSKMFQSSILSLVRSVGAFTTKSEYGHISQVEDLISGSDSSREVYQLSQNAIWAIRVIYESATGMAQAGYDNGYERGHNLLMELAEGTTSISEFNDRTIGE